MPIFAAEIIIKKKKSMSTTLIIVLVIVLGIPYLGGCAISFIFAMTGEGETKTVLDKIKHISFVTAVTVFWPLFVVWGFIYDWWYFTLGHADPTSLHLYRQGMKLIERKSKAKADKRKRV